MTSDSGLDFPTDEYLMANYELVSERHFSDDDVVIEHESGVLIAVPQGPASVSITEERVEVTKTNIKRQRNKKTLVPNKVKNQETSEHQQSKNSKPMRPNHFFAVQVSNSEILENAKLVQAKVTKQDKRLKAALIPVETLHLTLGVLHLADEDDIAKAKSVLETAGKLMELELKEKPLHMHVKGIRHFSNKVVYTCLHDIDDSVTRLRNAATILSEKCCEAGIPQTDTNGFKPHITLFKLSKDPQLYRKGVRSIPQHLYAEHMELPFGKQVTSSIQLLAMNEPKDINGYYACKSEFRFMCDFKQ